MTELSVPNSLARLSFALGSCTQAPSTMNLYWCLPGFSETVACQSPSPCRFNATVSGDQWLKSPASVTRVATGSKKLNSTATTSGVARGLGVTTGVGAGAGFVTTAGFGAAGTLMGAAAGTAAGAITGVATGITGALVTAGAARLGLATGAGAGVEGAVGALTAAGATMFPALAAVFDFFLLEFVPVFDFMIPIRV